MAGNNKTKNPSSKSKILLLKKLIHLKKFARDKSIDKTFQVVCKTCSGLTEHTVLTSIDETGIEHDGNFSFYWNTDYQIIQCAGCKKIAFRKEETDSESNYGDEQGYEIREFIYPKRTLETLDNPNFYNVPPTLARIYLETIDSYNNDNLIICGAGVRMLVESFCIENKILDGEIEIIKKGIKQKIRSNKLNGKIAGLHEKGKLTRENAEMLNELRFIGNNAVHELISFEKCDLLLALEIIENMLVNFYELQNKADRLKYKRLKKNK